MDTTIIRCVIATLNDIEVRGKNNLDKLLGSIMALENIAQDMEHLSQDKKQKEEANG